ERREVVAVPHGVEHDEEPGRTEHDEREPDPHGDLRRTVPDPPRERARDGRRPGPVAVRPPVGSNALAVVDPLPPPDAHRTPRMRREMGRASASRTTPMPIVTAPSIPKYWPSFSSL